MNDTNPTIFVKHHMHPCTLNRKPSSGGAWAFRLVSRDLHLSRSPVQFFRRLGDKTAKVLRLVYSQRSSRKVSSSAGHATLVRSRSLVDQTESHRAEAIEDCIEFLNSYSSLHRSSSVSLSTC
ncbi:hypothetical protein CRG98_025754 [Punica granatum]|nr:hypothetical protein CRG98_025754 [Punica granatum]